jgi:hypothetical protein
MLQLENDTAFVAALSVLPDRDGVESAYAVVKATFVLTGAEPQLAPRQAPLLAADVFYGDPAQTSLRALGEFGLPKPATDVLLIGQALAARADTRVLDVALRVGLVHKTVRVFGERRWEKGASGWQPSFPEPFDAIPLRWELAFGGRAAEPVDASEYEPRNPVGRGFVGRRDTVIADRPLPNLEDPRQLLRAPFDRPAPACFAPIAPTWVPRRDYAGTYDAAWQRERAPYLPRDFDPRYFQGAPVDLIAPGYLSGGEPVEVIGCTLGEPLRFALPRCTLGFEFDFDGSRLPIEPRLEMVLLEPDHQRLQLLWRAGIPVDKRLLKLRAVEVECPEYPRAATGA